ncbi:glycoside hydrolase family 78 protein [Brachybacterium sp. NBEC-018]|uniref:glycoside hydrolase family 78 protein n=1 Tax=Brachybacterium sp. NBEC-018 TaxID=2996004 RepID=UPI00217557C8|nr:glycoside hydrolase family 78 protein [Brachybacterium sp. NBEC-018]UVY83884.1 glycoside hydrolase family 78 protein [Brachybacterium sp. NBEC-018]
MPPIDASPARWITAPGPDPQNPQLRTVVEVPAPVRSATLRVTGLGTFRAHLGGREVGPGRLDPGLTDPRARIQVCELDVTALLSPGRSVLGIELGRGFHALTTPTVWRWEQAPWHGPVRAWAHLVAELEDGSTLEVATGEHWQVRPGPITADSMYAGETFEPSGDPGAWLVPGAEEDGWTQSVLADDAADGPLVPQRQPPVREIERITPAVVSASSDRLVLDMGRVIAGWCEYALAASVPPDAPALRLRARHGEKLLASGEVDCANEHVRGDRFQEDRVRLEPGHARTFAPRHSYKGFRYVQIDRVPDPAGADRGEPLTLRDLGTTGILAHAALTTASTLNSSDPFLERFDDAMRRSLSNNMHHVPTDTPMHEKNGWTGDALTALSAMTTSFDMHDMLAKWATDQADTLRPDGALAVIAPTPGWGYEELSPAPEWTCLLPAVLEELLLEYEDAEPLREHAAAAARHLEHELARRDEDGLISGVLGDYLTPGSPGPAPEEKRLSGTLAVAGGLRSLARALDLAGLPDLTGVPAPAALRAQAGDLEQAVNHVFLDPGRGLYRDPGTGLVRQTSQILPLAAGIVPPELERRVLGALVADLEARDAHHDCGHLGVRHLFPVLSAHGHGRLAQRVLGASGAPGWRDWLEAGNSSFMEMWENPRSCSHYFMGTPVTWIHEHVVGLRRGPDGWGEAIIAPDPDVDVARIAMTRRTVRGDLAVDMDRASRCLVLTVPASMRALVRLPGAPERSVGPGEHTMSW